MEILGAYGASDIWNLEETQKVDSRKKYALLQEETTASGDRVSISDEAKKLFSEMIHKYDQPASGGGDEAAGGEGQGQEGGQAGGAGGAGGSDSAGNSVEEIKKKIESLKSQLTALAAQAGNGADAAVMSKMSALEAEIGALESQLNSMGQA